MTQAGLIQTFTEFLQQFWAFKNDLTVFAIQVTSYCDISFIDYGYAIPASIPVTEQYHNIVSHMNVCNVCSISF